MVLPLILAGAALAAGGAAAGGAAAAQSQGYANNRERRRFAGYDKDAGYGGMFDQDREAAARSQYDQTMFGLQQVAAQGGTAGGRASARMAAMQMAPAAYNAAEANSWQLAAQKQGSLDRTMAGGIANDETRVSDLRNISSGLMSAGAGMATMGLRGGDQGQGQMLSDVRAKELEVQNSQLQGELQAMRDFMQSRLGGSPPPSSMLSPEEEEAAMIQAQLNSGQMRMADVPRTLDPNVYERLERPGMSSDQAAQFIMSQPQRPGMVTSDVRAKELEAEVARLRGELARYQAPKEERIVPDPYTSEPPPPDYTKENADFSKLSDEEKFLFAQKKFPGVKMRPPQPKPVAPGSPPEPPRVFRTPGDPSATPPAPAPSAPPPDEKKGFFGEVLDFFTPKTASIEEIDPNAYLRAPTQATIDRVAAEARARGTKSDERSKTGRTKGAALELFENTPGEFYSYKPGMGEDPGQRHFGPMAQDIEKSEAGKTMVKTGPDGLKRVDTERLSLAAAAGINELLERVKKLEARSGG